MNIFCSTDDNYAPYCAVMLTSLCENNKDLSIHVYLMTEGLTTENHDVLETVVNRYNGIFHYCLMDKSLFENCPIREGDHITLATYFRFLIPQLIPESEHTAIYLDVDMIILRSLKPLDELDLSDYAVAAVDEVGCSAPDVFERLNIPKSNSYFNAGLLVINLDYWREHNISEALFNYVSKNANILTAHDQDALNVLLNTKWLSLPQKWNWMSAFMHENHIINSESYNKVMAECHKICIIHYTENKPWIKYSKQPFINKYFYYQNLSGVSQKYHSTSKLSNLKRACRRLLESCGLIKMIYAKQFYMMKDLN